MAAAGLDLGYSNERGSPVLVEYMFLSRRTWPTHCTCLGALCNVTNIFSTAIHNSTSYKGDYDVWWRVFYYR